MGSSLSSRRFGRSHNMHHSHHNDRNSSINNNRGNGNHSNGTMAGTSRDVVNGNGVDIAFSGAAVVHGNGEAANIHASEHTNTTITALYPHENGIPLPGHGYPVNGYLPYLYPSVNYPPGSYIQGNGHFVINITQPPIVLPENAVPILPLPDLIQTPRANTIMNDVNLKKNTLRLEEDAENPGSYLVAFSFDATDPGWVCIFFHAKECQQCSLSALQPELYSPVRIAFEKGMDQHFKQTPGTGVKLSCFAESDLLNEGPGETFPLIIRTETISKDPPPDASSRDDEPLDSPLPKWVHAGITHAVLEKKEDGYAVKVVKQIIYVNGMRYELQEIYGIENADGSIGIDGNDVGKECVICLSELRDTTVLPCRHMCMCSGCAKVLRFQSNRCPICRTPVERFLEIKVSKKEGDQDQGQRTTVENGPKPEEDKSLKPEEPNG